MRLIWFSLLLPLVCSASTNQPEGVYEILARQVALQQPCPQDVHTVLREMSVSLAEQKVKISVLEKVNEDNVENRKELERQTVEINKLKQGYVEKIKELERQKIEVNKLKQDNVENRKELERQKVEDNKLKQDNVENRKELERQKVEINKLKEVKQVAFSASLVTHGTTNFGPYNTFKTMVFKRVITNIGNAYNPHTGIFSAPVRGVYHFEWHISVHGGNQAAAVLIKNGERIAAATEHQSSHFGTASNGAAMLLEAGDVVYVSQWINTKIFDNHNHHTSFSGYLLFTM